MEDDKSPIIDFYPKDFTTDLNGKQQDWEAVVLIPFIDEVKQTVILQENLASGPRKGLFEFHRFLSF